MWIQSLFLLYTYFIKSKFSSFWLHMKKEHYDNIENPKMKMNAETWGTRKNRIGISEKDFIKMSQLKFMSWKIFTMKNNPKLPDISNTDDLNKPISYIRDYISQGWPLLIKFEDWLTPVNIVLLTLAYPPPCCI